MCSCLGSSLVLDNKSRRQENLQNESFSLSVSIQLKETTVRIVHAGGRIEMYQNAILASKLLQKYPDMCIARPDVFKRPHKALLSPDEILLPGNKYFVVRSSTMEKLKRRHSRKLRNNESDKNDVAILESGEIMNSYDESVCSSSDFYVSKDKWSVLRKHVREKKQFVPPIQRPRMRRETEWEPSLTSIQEVSP